MLTLTACSHSSAKPKTVTAYLKSKHLYCLLDSHRVTSNSRVYDKQLHIVAQFQYTRDFHAMLGKCWRYRANIEPEKDERAVRNVGFKNSW